MNLQKEKTRIGWIGTGVMGFWMCRHIIDAGYAVTVYNRTKSKAQPLIDEGAQWADSPRETAEHSDIVFSIVGYPQDVEQVYFGDDGILNGAAPGTITVDMTTTKLSLALRIYESAVRKSCSSIDAPVSGGDVGAKEGRLAVMAGGDPDAFKTVEPLFNLMGRHVIYEGKPGSGQHTKMCNQIQIAGTMIGMCESLLYGYRAGLDISTMVSTISKGAAGCWSLDNLAPRVAGNDFDPGFMIEHFIKDMGIALEEAERMDLSLPGLALAHQLYIAAKGLGHGRDGTQALILALDKLAGSGQFS